MSDIKEILNNLNEEEGGGNDSSSGMKKDGSGVGKILANLSESRGKLEDKPEDALTESEISLTKKILESLDAPEALFDSLEEENYDEVADFIEENKESKKSDTDEEKLSEMEEVKVMKLLGEANAPMTIYRSFQKGRFEKVADFLEEKDDSRDKDPVDEDPVDEDESSKDRLATVISDSYDTSDKDDKKDKDDEAKTQTSESLSYQERIKARKLLEEAEAPGTIFRALYNKDYDIVEGYISDYLKEKEEE